MLLAVAPYRKIKFEKETREIKIKKLGYGFKAEKLIFKELPNTPAGKGAFPSRCMVFEEVGVDRPSM